MCRRVAGKKCVLLRCLLMTATLSLSIELLQPLINGARSADITDLITNAIGGLIGYVVYLTICPKKKSEKWLRTLLLIHGVFFISCLLLPMLGIFQADSPAWIGVAVLEFWCAYFCPVAILSLLYFKNKESS